MRVNRSRAGLAEPRMPRKGDFQVAPAVCKPPLLEGGGHSFEVLRTMANESDLHASRGAVDASWHHYSVGKLGRPLRDSAKNGCATADHPDCFSDNRRRRY